MKLRKERSIVAVYDAVSISKDIEVSGGPLTLNFYAESRSYIPNRFITPIILTPKIYVADPNKVIADGDKHTELTECIWYMNGERIVSDDAFKINKDNTLTVFKNSEKDYTISYSATWFDTRKKLNIYIEDSVQFITIALGDGNLLPRINIDKAQNWIHNPLKGEKKYSIKAYISKDKVYEGAVEWYYNYVGKPLVLFDEKCKFYVKGLYTNELIIDSSKASNCVITAKNLSKEKLQLYYWFFDENGNPISNNEPVYKEISSKEPITLPVDTIEIAAKYNILGDTLLINNPSLLNITDEEFNKAYGINPEWDGHMEEVFGKEIGRRNLILNSGVEKNNGNIGKWIKYNLNTDALKAGKKYIFTLDFTYPNQDFDSPTFVITNSDWGGGNNTIIKVGSPFILKGVKSKIALNSNQAIIVKNLKLEEVEEGGTSTPWTPAPEDLNYRNFVVNGDFRNGLEGWIANGVRLIDGIFKFDKIWGSLTQYTQGKEGDIVYITALVTKMFNTEYRLYYEGSYIGEPLKNGVNTALVSYKQRGQIGIQITKLDTSVNDNGKLELDFMVSINLTEKFGKGNEPTKEVCDELFAHYGYIPAPEDLNYPTIKPTTIESVLLPLTINSVSSTIGGLEKSSMEIKKSLGKNEGLTLQSLVKNGKKEFKLTDSVISNSGIALYDKSVYYIKCNIVNIDESASIGLRIQDKLKVVDIKNNTTSDYFVSNKDAENKNVGYYTTSEEKPIISELVLVNLTSTFGAGNEPTKEWCDEHFKDYFDGTLLINIPIKKEDLSQYKITNLSSLKRLGTSVDYIENGTLHKSIELINFTGNETWVKEKAYSGIRYHMVLPYRVQGELLCNNFPTYNTITDLTTITPEGFSLVKGIYDKIYFTASDETTKPNENTQLLLLLHKPTSELLNTSGAINMKQGGTIFVENIITTDYLYNKGITLTSDYSIKLIISLTGNTSSLDINKCVIKDNIITHPDLQNGAYGTITYEYNSNTIKGLTTMKYMNVSDLLDTLWLEDIYTYKAKINPTGNITEWELVKLTDIENYEEWLSKDKLSENNLAPDGIIPGRYSTSVKYMRLYPSSLYVDFLAPTIVKDGTTKIKARAIVGTTDGILENPSQFFKVTWLKRNIKPGQLDVVIGTGNELVIDISNKDSITIEIEELPIK